MYIHTYIFLKPQRSTHEYRLKYIPLPWMRGCRHWRRHGAPKTSTSRNRSTDSRIAHWGHHDVYADGCHGVSAVLLAPNHGGWWWITELIMIFFYNLRDFFRHCFGQKISGDFFRFLLGIRWEWAVKNVHPKPCLGRKERPVLYYPWLLWDSEFAWEDCP